MLGINVLVGLLFLFSSPCGFETVSVRATGTCVDDSFELTAAFSPTTSYGENKMTVVAQISPKSPLPTGFNSAAEYRNTCLNSVLYNLVKKDAPSTTIETIVALANQPQQAIFENLNYLVDYQIKILYNQKSPDSNKQYDAKTYDFTTCYGEPTQVKNLNTNMGNNGQLEIKWDKPDTVNAPNVCYYEVFIVNSNSNEKKKYETDQLSFVDPDSYPKYSKSITVLAINSNSFKGRLCYPQYKTDGCNNRGSGGITIKWDYVAPTNPPTTTKKNNASALRYFNPLSAVIGLFSVMFFI